MRGATVPKEDASFFTEFQPTLPVRGATCNIWYDGTKSSISTHAPRAGSDGSGVSGRVDTAGFQPTLPVRGATWTCTIPSRRAFYFNPRSPYGERPEHPVPTDWAFAISTHAPRAGSDRSTTALRRTARHFNPRSPCGERLDAGRIVACKKVFQPTLPVRGATHFCTSVAFPSRFQPTLPVRGATQPVQLSGRLVCISTHAPRAGSDPQGIHHDITVNIISTHAPRAGSDATCAGW